MKSKRNLKKIITSAALAFHAGNAESYQHAPTRTRAKRRTNERTVYS